MTKLLSILLLINIKMANKTRPIISLVFLSLIILISFVYINGESFTGKATQTTIKNITSVGNFDDLITQGLISPGDNCEEFGTMQKANIGSVEGETKLVSGQIEFSEQGCKTDISELMKNGRDVHIEGVSISRVGGVDMF